MGNLNKQQHTTLIQQGYDLKHNKQFYAFHDILQDDDEDEDDDDGDDDEKEYQI